MKTYKLTLEPKSPFITPLQSDTIFGHLAWAIVYEQGEMRLKEILDEFRSGSPPFLLSSAFPEGTLPTPVLPPLTRGEIGILVRRRLGNIELSTLRQLSEDIKKIQNIPYIDMLTFRDLAQGLSPLTLTERLLESLEQPKPRLVERVVMRTAVDRITGTAKEGRLFDHSECFYATRVTIWLKLKNDLWKEDIHRWFKIVEASGFGKRKSTGMGQFQLTGGIEEAESELPQATEPNAFMTLSSYVPRADDPVEGYYRHIVKRGKLGGPKALGGNVWKRPLLMFTLGSIFYDQKIADFYGGLVPDVYPDDPRIVQYAYALPLGVKIISEGDS